MNSSAKIIEKKIDISNSENIEILITEINSLSGKGYKEVTVRVEGFVKTNLDSEGIDEKVFNEIVKIQELPEWVVYKLFKSKGAISDSSFSKKVNTVE
jgi:hypothetical protein